MKQLQIISITKINLVQTGMWNRCIRQRSNLTENSKDNRVWTIRFFFDLELYHWYRIFKDGSIMVSRSKMPLGDWLTELEGSNLTEAEVGHMFGFLRQQSGKCEKAHETLMCGIWVMTRTGVINLN